MRTIILEGSSASGKTTVAKKLIDSCENKNLSCLLVEEKKTLMPILSNRVPQISLDHLQNIIIETYKQSFDVVIFDRLHLTPIAITHSTVAEFIVIEKKLKKHQPLLVFLELDEEKIPERIFDSIKHRSPSWGEHVRRKGSRDQIIAHYVEAQRKLQKLISQTTLPKVVYDTTQSNFDEIAHKILQDYI